MRVLLIAPQPFFVERGTPIAVKLLAETLCEMGHRVDLLTYHEGRDVAVPGLRIVRVPKLPGVRNIPIGFSWKKAVADVFLFGLMAALTSKNRYDVLHAVEESIFPAAVLRSFSRHKLVYDMDSSLSDQLVEKWPGMRVLKRGMDASESWVLRRADLVLPVCPRLGEKAGRSVPSERIVILEDIAFEASEGAEGVEDLRRTHGVQGPLVMYVGNLEHYQGIDLLLESVAGVRRDLSFRLVVIGGTQPAVTLYEKKAAQLGIGDRVCFAGAKSFGRLPHYLAQADILVSPRIKGENTPMKIYSYLASGRPVLATNIDSHTQVLDSRSAMLVDANVREMAAGLTQLLENQSLREDLGCTGKALATERYSLAAYKVKLREGYRRLSGDQATVSAGSGSQ
jgi:glycosyltransferase involved in cell wall biosynthesis